MDSRRRPDQDIILLGFGSHIGEIRPVTTLGRNDGDVRLYTDSAKRAVLKKSRRPEQLPQLIVLVMQRLYLDILAEFRA